MRTRHLLKIAHWQHNETRGQPITAYGKQITPVGRALHIRWPAGGFVWHRPVAVEVHEGEATYRLPIRDTTSRAIAGLTLISIVVALILALLINKQAKEKS